MDKEKKEKKKEEFIITSALDNDLYKFTMMQAVYHQFAKTQVRSEFKCRDEHIKLDPSSVMNMVAILSEQFEHLKQIKFTQDDIDYLARLGFFSMDFLDYLLGRSVCPEHVTINFKQTGDLFELSYEGTWLDTILLEVPMLAIISEVVLETFTRSYREISFDESIKKSIEDKLDFCIKHPLFKFADFGTRRRFSKEYQDSIIKTFVEAAKEHKTKALIGSSNVMFAKKYGIKPIGTHAHEWFQAMQAKTNIKNFQRFALQTWANEYRGKLGIALTDCVGMDYFLKDFDLYFAKLFDGCRHDSGDPYVWCNKLINHYMVNNIDPLTKTAVFSDGLNFEKGLKLIETFRHSINVSLGIGTFFTNNISSTVRPLSIVIKMTDCDGQPVAKLSDSPGKSMCKDADYVNFLNRLFKGDTL